MSILSEVFNVLKIIHTKMRNKLEWARMSWNKLEQPEQARTSWNHLEQAGTN